MLHALLRPLALTAALALGGCAAKSRAAVQAPAPTPTALVAVNQAPEGGLAAAPEPLQARLTAALEARNLVPRLVDEAAAAEAFAARRATPQRLAWLAQVDDEAKLLVLVESEVEFYSQLSGRFRWTVTVHASVSPRGEPAQAVSSSFTVPVFLQFHHEREEAALIEAAPIIERQVGYLLDEVVGGLGQ